MVWGIRIGVPLGRIPIPETFSGIPNSPYHQPKARVGTWQCSLGSPSPLPLPLRSGRPAMICGATGSLAVLVPETVQQEHGKVHLFYAASWVRSHVMFAVKVWTTLFEIRL